MTKRGSRSRPTGKKAAANTTRARVHSKDNHQPMNGPEQAISPTVPSQSHHGHEGLDTTSGSMDNPSASQVRATPASPSDETMKDLSSTNPPPLTHALPPKPPKIESPSSKPEEPSPTLPSLTVSQPPPRPGEPVFEGPLLFCQQAYERSKPHVEQDLFGLYGLTTLAQGVARRDLTTGEKINTMRKTYAGQIKMFQLAGKNKAFAHNEGGIGMNLSELVMWPQLEWQNQKMSGRNLSGGLSGDALAKLDKALKLEPGAVPKNAEWESALGLEKVKHVPKTESKVGTPGGPTSKPTKPDGLVNGSSKNQQDSDINRPKRAGKKRRYNDDSFEGYGEGFDDEAEQEGGLYSGDESRRGSQKKRRKDFSPMNSPSTIGTGIGGYAAGLVTPGRGIGAYGAR